VTVVIAATSVTIAVDLAKVITAGGQVVYLLAVKLRTLIVSGLNERYDGSMTTKVGLDELERQHDVLAGINAAALAAGVLDAELDR
jgi:hypothetical protein